MPRMVPASPNRWRYRPIGSSTPTLARFRPEATASAGGSRHRKRWRQRIMTHISMPAATLRALVTVGVAVLAAAAASSLPPAAGARASARGFARASGLAVQGSDAAGFIQRWLVLDDSCVRTNSPRVPSRPSERNTRSPRSSMVPRDGQTVTVGDERARLARRRHARLQRQLSPLRLRS